MRTRHVLCMHFCLQALLLFRLKPISELVPFSMQVTQVSACVMQLAEVLVPGLAGAVVPRCGRRPLCALVHSDGPPVLCVVIGMPQGRWHAELTGVSPAARECRRLLTIANGVTTVSDVAVDAPATFGLAVLLGWRFCA